MRPRVSRVALDIALVVGVLYLPWYITLLIGLFILAVSPGFEVMLAGFALDILYGDQGLFGVPVPFSATAAASMLFFAAFIVKRRFIRARL